MRALIDAAFARTRLVGLSLIAILIAGAQAYTNSAREAESEVTIPPTYVSLIHEGISPTDAERLLLRPMEQELQSIPGLEEIRSVAGEGYATLALEFDAGFDPDAALRDVREQVDIAQSELPAATEEPRVTEVNTALFPVLTVALSGSLPERDLVARARELRDALEGLGPVLEVDPRAQGRHLGPHQEEADQRLCRGYQQSTANHRPPCVRLSQCRIAHLDAVAVCRRYRARSAATDPL